MEPSGGTLGWNPQMEFSDGELETETIFREFT